MKVTKNDFQYMLECMERDLATHLVEKRGITIRQALSILYDSDTYRLLLIAESKYRFLFSVSSVCILIFARGD